MDYLTQIQNRKQSEAEAAKTQSVIDAIQSSSGATKDSLSSAMHDILMATLIGKDPKLAQVAKNLGDLLGSIAKASDNFRNSGIEVIPKTFNQLTTALQALPDQVAATDKSPELIPYLQRLDATIRQNRPVFNPNIDAKVDVSPLKTLLESINKSIKDNKINVPKTDVSSLESAIKSVERTIKGLSFPVPNYVLPFKDSTGKAVQLELDSNGRLPVDTESTSPSTAYNGTFTVPTGTSTAIASSQAVQSVTVKALSTNTVAIYVGASGTTVANGFELLPGEGTSLDIDNLADVFAISGSASQNLRYIAVG